MRLSIGAVALVAVLATPLVGAAQDAELAGNVGFSSEYFFRGISQKTASASGGLDLAVSKVYVGSWAADVGDGNEVDVYAGIGHEVDDFSVSVGGTAYLYTGDFSDNILEGNFNAGYGPVSAEFSYGWVQASVGDDPQYWFFAGTVEQWGLYATVGVFGKDLDGEYYEAGYGVSVADFDVTASWIYSTDTILGTPDVDDHTIVLSISHTFDIDLD